MFPMYLIVLPIAIVVVILAMACVHFVPPKRVHVITLLGTKPIAMLKTGIHFTIPRPFAVTSAVIPTDVIAQKVQVQIKSQDNLVFELPATIQFRVTNAMRFAFERDEPVSQMINLVVAALRSAANRLAFQDIYNDKSFIQQEVETTVSEHLSSFGLKIVDLVIDDPELPSSTRNALNGIREAEWSRRAAEHEAEATRVKMVGAARAEAESTLLKAKAIAGFRMEIAEGNAASIAVMQGRIGVEWVESTIGEGETAQQVKTPVYVDRNGNPTMPPEMDMSPEAILEFFKMIDANEAIRDASAGKGTVILMPHSAGQRSPERHGSDLAEWIAAKYAAPHAQAG
jgi:regulator of protease activity HflC (stomatin/prohibitin superfamily)